MYIDDHDILGEKLKDPECEDIMKSCAGQEDEDGFIKYEGLCQKVLFKD